ncbi:hypothetical protein NQ318_015053 [Aromia moschata]|uniref:Ciliogenesis-associated TTC17-interacting protein N-terminal domain-containing protein n=1 Tax=Aromia moschata TaxID=1265417 RepID=A0AAV8YYX4_9CUCU|nr:hypothetical protein NQ318_015053 [Aromia moschata]
MSDPSEAVMKTSPEQDKLERRLQAKLDEYERFLRNEMRQNVKKFVVHMSSQFDVGGYDGGSRITAWVDRYLHTLEEKRTEYVSQPHEVLNQKSLYTALQNRKYYLKSTSTLDNVEERKYYGINKTKELVCEGASFILMRYLAVTRYQGTFELSTMYINGDMCRNIYECTGPTTGEVNGKTVGICKIYRYIVEECGLEHHCVTVLTVYGRIITQEWEGCNYILNLNPLQYVSEPPSSCDRLVLEKTWTDDMQLMSKYLDCKTKAERKMKNYMADHPEIKEMMSDYVQNVLLLKPENVLSFTMDYFQSLYPFKLARLPYFEQPTKEDSDVEFYG